MAKVKVADGPQSSEGTSILLYKAFVTGCFGLSALVFEQGSNLKHIEALALWHCSGLESTCIPASVEILCINCFQGCIWLQSLTFDINLATPPMSDALGHWKRVTSQVFNVPAQCLRNAIFRNMTKFDHRKAD
jgi:hypothetical protein